MSLLPPDYWKNQGPLMGSPDGSQEQTMPSNPIGPSMGNAGGMGMNNILKYLMQIMQQGQNNQQPQNPIGPSGNLPGASQRSFGFMRHYKPSAPPKPGDMINNGWGGKMPYDPNFTGVT